MFCVCCNGPIQPYLICNNFQHVYQVASRLIIKLSFARADLRTDIQKSIPLDVMIRDDNSNICIYLSRIVFSVTNNALIEK